MEMHMTMKHGNHFSCEARTVIFHMRRKQKLEGVGKTYCLHMQGSRHSDPSLLERMKNQTLVIVFGTWLCSKLHLLPLNAGKILIIDIWSFSQVFFLFALNDLLPWKGHIPRMAGQALCFCMAQATCDSRWRWSLEWPCHVENLPWTSQLLGARNNTGVFASKVGHGARAEVIEALQWKHLLWIG